MSWINPHTWFTGEVITAANLNQDVRDNSNYLKEHSVPTGAILPFGGSTAPAGYLLCDGSAVNRTGYADLFAVLSTTYGVGNGSTTFNVPDLRSRLPLGSGAGAGLTARSRGASGGDETHTILEAELATHHHGVGAHIHLLKTFNYDAPTTSSPTFPMINQSAGSTGSLTTEGASGSTNTTDVGSDTPIDIMNPFLVVNYIIKT